MTHPELGTYRFAAVVKESRDNPEFQPAVLPRDFATLVLGGATAWNEPVFLTRFACGSGWSTS